MILRLTVALMLWFGHGDLATWQDVIFTKGLHFVYLVTDVLQIWTHKADLYY